MSITDELREWASVEVPYKYGHQLTAIADRIDAEHESKCKEARDEGERMRHLIDCAKVWERYLELPKDADGKYIRIGDELDYLEALHPDVPSRFKVQDMFYSGNGEWRLRAYPATYDPEKCRHYHAPTVEDVLREMHEKLDEVTALYVGEAIDSDERDRDEARIFAEYAKRLTLAEREDA